MIEIIPAIDIIDGKCVRLTQGDFAQKKIYNENPEEVARSFEDAGIKRLHLVDLDGAKHEKPVNLNVLETIAKKTNLIIDFGGGIKTTNDAEQVFSSGASMITAGSIAVKNKALVLEWIEKFGTDKIILGTDVKNKQIAIHGWQDNSGIDIIDFIQGYILSGIKYTICTDVSKDGLLAGTSLDLYKEIQTAFPPLHIIASGGVSSMDDIIALNNAGFFGVIVGKAIYEGRITLEEIANFKK